MNPVSLHPSGQCRYVNAGGIARDICMEALAILRLLAVAAARQVGTTNRHAFCIGREREEREREREREGGS